MRRRYLCGAFVGVLATAGAISATAGGAATHVPHGRIHRITNSTSTNWSGYAVTGNRFTSVSASWTEPTAKCSGTAYSSFWVGLDGDTSGPSSRPARTRTARARRRSTTPSTRCIRNSRST